MKSLAIIQNKKIEQLTTKLEQLSKELEEIKKKQSEAQTKVNELNVQKDELNLKLYLTNQQKFSLTQLATELKQQLHEAQSISRFLGDKLLDKEVLHQQRKIKNQSQVEELNIFIGEILSGIRKRDEAINGQKDETQKGVQTINACNDDSILSRLLDKQILLQKNDLKLYILNAIQEKTSRKRIQSTKLLYCYDPLNPASFHQYIDGKDNFLIIVQGTKGNIFGAFTTAKFVDKTYHQPEDTIAFLFTLNPQLRDSITCFDLKKQPNKCRSVIYDEFYLTIGNSDLRWRKGQNYIQIKSFALPYGYYNSRGLKVEDLTQEEPCKREISIKGFQCFQINLEEQ